MFVSNFREVSEIENWTEDDYEWEEVVVQRGPVPFVQAVDQVEQGAQGQQFLGHWIVRHLFSALLYLELAHRRLYVECFYGAHEDAWNLQDKAETNEPDNDLVRLDLVKTFKEVAHLSEPDCHDLD